MRYFISEGIFEFPDIHLVNKFSISTWFDDLHFSASNTVEAVAKMA